MTFGPEHIISVMDRWPLLEKNVFVSARSQRDDVRPGWVYREEPDSEQDSGWRALIGDESQDDVDNADNILLQPVGYLLDRWPELRPVFETDPAIGSWLWNDGSSAYALEE